MRVITRDTWRAQPWKNGGGTTSEIWRTPDDGEYDVRVSLAEVTQSGPFSQFPGDRRWSFLVGPGPIELVHEQAFELVARGDHIELPGESAIIANLRGGATQLLNVLARIPIVAGFGPIAHPVRFVFTLDTSVARVFDPPESVQTTDCVWIT
ncbi:MAG: HutD family protein [Deltaproteobacteria bacterium]|nr:HutD family protein [Deltaproteobacteria bacterium]